MQVAINASAQDLDAGENATLSYTLAQTSPAVTAESAEYFTVDEVSGVVNVSRTLDRETVEWINLTITARDFGVPPRSATITTSVQVMDVNDNIPQFVFPTEGGTFYRAYVDEENSVGAFLLRVRATDVDNTTITYALRVSWIYTGAGYVLCVSNFFRLCGFISTWESRESAFYVSIISFSCDTMILV